MSNWRIQQEEVGMDEIDGDMGGVDTFHHQEGFESGNIKNQERTESLCDSGLGSIASTGTSSLRGSETEEMMARMTILEEIYAEGTEDVIVCQSKDDGYCSTSFTSGNLPYTPLPEHRSNQTETQYQSLAEAIYAQDQDGDTKLHVAISQRSPMSTAVIDLAPTVEHLNIYNKMVLTPLHMAVITNQPLVVRRLVMLGARLEVRDAEGNTPLHIACREGQLHVVQALTKPLSGPELVHSQAFPVQQIPQDLDLKNYDGYTCVHLACQQRLPFDTLMYLINHLGADINIRDGLSGRTVLHHAVDAGDVSATQVLIQQCHANVNAQAYSGCTPLRIAIGRQHSTIICSLRQAGAYEPNSESSTESDYSTEDEMIDDFTIGGRPVTAVSS